MSDPRKVLLVLDNRTGVTNTHRVRDHLSAVVAVGDSLWLGCDEGTSLERLNKADEQTYSNHQRSSLNRTLELSDEGGEIDIEGLDYSDGYLWLVGSHSLKRSQPQPDRSTKKNLKRLCRLDREGNRYRLARVPLVQSGSGYSLQSGLNKCPQRGKVARAARVDTDKSGSVLYSALASDEHLGRFSSIPGKDNGLDIEGLAVSGDNVFLGLRGPVLRGWAVILKLRARTKGKSLRLSPLDRKKQLYIKHFVDLDGYGVRDLTFHGEDLLILAGPTMDLQGPVVVYRWPSALHQEKGRFVWSSELERTVLAPLEESAGKAEGFTWFDPDKRNELLVVYDSPDTNRRDGDFGVRADLFAWPQPRR
jgi:hypothetical protein